MTMSFFLKLNIVSLLYGWIFFICMTLQLNYYRLLRLTGWTADNLDLFLLIVQLVGLSVATIFIYKLTVTWLGHRRWIYATMILWLPYTVIFTMVFTYLFPISDRGDMPVPVQGLILLVMLWGYPLYIAIISLAART
ncbi:hypothetical protein ACQKEY_00985 [Lysinibacillus fusiformis]|uniref:hypothetical protein n=2 Tax=Bacillaceae TaxID=186817 RepID=UPI0000F3711F|nr:hypothetical protein BB14905_17995 [Bacillus sp. B14905]MCG7436096.1 hypothetical protein [Lysinibacillus fusiformis]PCD84688.1 hypothetical protein CNQ87_10080 [Lysinibacillus fusiformis]